MFALRHKGSEILAGFTVSSNSDGEFCGEVAYELEVSIFNDNVWVTTKREVAEYAANVSTEWYNADFDTPINPYVGEFEVVELKY